MPIKIGNAQIGTECGQSWWKPSSWSRRNWKGEIMTVAVRTEWHDGLEFEVPTWDPTPVEWNAQGSWAKDPELEARLLDAIRAAVPNHEELVAQALVATGDGSCRTYWGSHGCDLTAEHDGLHVCGKPGDHCSAILPWGTDSTAILWWSFVGHDDFTLSAHHWTWFR